jgi:hypothetical protein
VAAAQDLARHRLHVAVELRYHGVALLLLFLRALPLKLSALLAVGVALPPTVRQDLISISQITRNVVPSRFFGADFYVRSL